MTDMLHGRIPAHPGEDDNTPVDSHIGGSTPSAMNEQPESQPAHTHPAITFSHPALMMLGPVHLHGARGTTPTRSQKACTEFCAWLLHHPGQTAPTMARSLSVAETTRRSTVSRLRNWLGRDQQGNPYLPEAYNGHITLNPVVTSDWERLNLLIGAGIESTTTDNLTHALKLVRGTPLQNATPGQWQWAAQLRSEMTSVIRNIGVHTVHRCLEEGDTATARWAGQRALMAAPEDEALLTARILTEHTIGNHAEVDRLSTWLTRNARNNGRKLQPQTLETLIMVITQRTPNP